MERKKEGREEKLKESESLEDRSVYDRDFWDRRVGDPATLLRLSNSHINTVPLIPKGMKCRSSIEIFANKV